MRHPQIHLRNDSGIPNLINCLCLGSGGIFQGGCVWKILRWDDRGISEGDLGDSHPNTTKMPGTPFNRSTGRRHPYSVVRQFSETCSSSRIVCIQV